MDKKVKAFYGGTTIRIRLLIVLSLVTGIALPAGGGGEFGVIEYKPWQSVINRRFQSKKENQKIVNFLVSDNFLRQGNGTFQAIDGKSPVSFIPPKLSYWGDYVCGFGAGSKLCESKSVWHRSENLIADANLFQRDDLKAYRNVRLQLERVIVEYGSSVYDSAVWQIAIAIAVRSGLLAREQGMELIDNQLRRINRTEAKANPDFTYGKNKTLIPNIRYAYTNRFLVPQPRLQDPLVNSAYSALLVPTAADNVAPGDISWLDWKPISGENAWAYMLGPLHASLLMHGSNPGDIRFHDASLQSALSYLFALQRMQSELGPFYFAANESLGSDGEKLLQGQFSTENNFSVAAGLVLLKNILIGIDQSKQSLSLIDKARLNSAVNVINIMLYGGETPDGLTKGLLWFLKEKSYYEAESTFHVGGTIIEGVFKSAHELQELNHFAVDINTWGVATIGPKTIDEWFGTGTAYKLWLTVKEKGGYVKDGKLLGVGYSSNADDKVLSSEWTFGALNMTRILIEYYSQYPAAGVDLEALKADERSMEKRVRYLRNDNYRTQWKKLADGVHPRYLTELPRRELGYLYASKRYFVPFGWYANPFLSSASTAWSLIWSYQFNPFSPLGSYKTNYFNLSSPPDYDPSNYKLAYDTRSITIIGHEEKDTAIVYRVGNESALIEPKPKHLIPAGTFTSFTMLDDVTELKLLNYSSDTKRWHLVCRVPLNAAQRKQLMDNPLRNFIKAKRSNPAEDLCLTGLDNRDGLLAPGANFKTKRLEVYVEAGTLWDIGVCCGGVAVNELVDAVDPSHGKVVEFSYSTDTTVTFFQSAEPMDLRAWAGGTIEFDLLVLQQPAGANWFVKADCQHPCGSNEISLADSMEGMPPSLGVWQHYTFKIEDLVSRGLELDHVDAPLVIFPTWGNQKGAKFRIDNIEIIKP